MHIYKPHINISNDRILQTVLNTSLEEFEGWSDNMRSISLELASEFFILHSNPFVDPEVVKNNVFSRLEEYTAFLGEEEAGFLYAGLSNFWQEYNKLLEHKEEIKSRLREQLPEESIIDSPHALVQNATDATGLIMELPLLVLFPDNTEQVQQVVLLARELGFSIVPRGGGSGLTGGAVPALRNSVILSIAKLKEIFEVDPENQLLTAQAGVITLDAIKAAEEQGMLFTVDPASKSASSLGGNIAENAGGPYAFEYGTTLDNIFSYKMVRPDGEVIEVRRKNHPWHKIYPEEEACFEIFDQGGDLLDTISLQGAEIRSPALGKDVTNKFLGGLPGVQKEGVDGIITEARFTLHPKLDYSQTLCMEFYGSSMHNAALVIKDLVNLRDKIREKSSLVTMSALEEFGSKYVKAIQYEKKSTRYEGEPISVLLIQLDSNDEQMLRDIVWTIINIAELYDSVDVFVAEDEEEAARYWEDRHKLSAISKRTSGFKINEDIVIPLDQIPAFSDFLESMNLKYLAIAYQKALQQVLETPGIDPEDEFIKMELKVTRRLLSGEILEHVAAEQDFSLQIHYFFQDLFARYPRQRIKLQRIEDELFNTRLEIANHMHAGDGNCHVNIPVHANNPEMHSHAEQIVDRVFEKALELGGQVSGEHGIGITKINYLSSDKIEDLSQYREWLDPDRIMNPEKLSHNELAASPYTFSWDKLIQDFSSATIPRKEQLSQQLKHIQICTRCGKCKQVCPMYYPQKGMLYHPRNKNISMGALLDALLYTQSTSGDTKPSQDLLAQLKELMDFCTACGKCMTTCPVKIDNAEVTINMRSYLESEGTAGWGLKSKMLNYLGQDPERIQSAAKIATLGQNIQNRAIRFLPSFWRRRAENPMFQAPGPKLEYGQVNELLQVSKGNLFSPHQPPREGDPAVIYFPGCGSGLFYSSIALASVYSLLYCGYTVLLPQEHLCCGYPLLSAGCTETFERNTLRNTSHMEQLLAQAGEYGLRVQGFLTSCGTCRAAFENYRMEEKIAPELRMRDVFQFLSGHLEERMQIPEEQEEEIIFHSSCHTAMNGVNPAEADQLYSRALEDILNQEVQISVYCCAESGLGALTNPRIYNSLRERKINALNEILENASQDPTILVSCPSCRIGISRSLIAAKSKGRTLHTMEYMAEKMKGKKFKNEIKNEILSMQVQPAEEVSNL